MTFEELLKACASGELPAVSLKEPVKYATSNAGKVVVIKANNRHRGIGVQFPGVPYDTWFHEINTGDKRSKYMDELELIK